MYAAVAEGADLFRHERDVLDTVEARQDCALGGLVDRGRLVAAFTRADHGLAVRTRRQLRQDVAHVDDRLTAEREPVSQVDGKAGPR